MPFPPAESSGEELEAATGAAPGGAEFKAATGEASGDEVVGGRLGAVVMAR
jgi:hypothetical protein